MTFEQFITDSLQGEDVGAEDVLASFLPLLREVIETHRLGLVAPLEGTQDLQVDGVRLWFEEAKRRTPRSNATEIARLEPAGQAIVEVLDETRRTTEVDDGTQQIIRSEIGTRGAPVTRLVYLPGYISWEHELGHHDPLTDAFSLGQILTSLSCGLNLNEPADLESFVANRRNLFALNPRLHPVLAQAILRLTDLDRRKRPQDLTGLLRTLENYRDQSVDFAIDLARVPGFQTRDRHTRHEIDLATTNLDALFDYLAGKIQASEPAVSLTKIDRPRIDLVHEKAKRRLDQYRRSARVAGRGVRSFLDLDYSSDLANYHPLGIKLFSALVKTPGSHLRDIIEEKPRPRSFAAPDENAAVVEKEKSFYQVRDATEANPYLWNFDLCTLTLANLRYRRMSLVRDYEAILQQELTNPAFETTFSLAPRPLGRELPPVPSLEERFDVVTCDPTQATAIAEARRGGSYIIQGPPGTGKSQTITNLIADYVARGKRVLFVCEKRAAIDVVFARLRQCGLGPLCSLIHDSQTDKKEFILDLKQTYELFTADSPPSAGQASRKGLLRKLQSNLQPLQKFEESMESEAQLAGLPLRQFLDRCVRLAAVRPTVTPEDAERLPMYQHWWAHRDQLASLDTSLRDLEPSGVLGRHPLRRLKPELSTHQRPMETVSTAVQRATGQLEHLLKALSTCGIPADQWNSLRRINELLDYMQAIAPLARHGNLVLIDSTHERARQFETSNNQLKQLEGSLATARQGTTAWREKLPPGDLSTAIDQARGWEGKFFAWLSPTWWRLRKVLNRAYDFKSHTVRPTWTQVLAALEKEYAAQAAFDQFNQQTKSTFGGELEPSRLQQEITLLKERAAHLTDWLRRIHTALLKSPKAESIAERTLQGKDSFAACSTDLASILVDFEDLPLDSLRRELKAISTATRQVPQALAVLGELESVPAEIARTLREFPFELPAAEAAIAHRTWEELKNGDRELSRFDGRLRQRHIHRVERQYDEWLTANAVEICDRVRQRFREHLQTTNLANSQLSADQREFKKSYLQGRRTLEHEFGKTMRFKAIRELVDGDAGQVIRDLKPVWLMSPLSVSDTLPLVIDFVDVVIFDEASQVPLEESVPSLFRGIQVIVVGDEMQLPPTDFFSTKQASEEEDGELTIEEGDERVQYELSSDSFLSHAARNLPATMLGWHYRSRSESLISFSNWAFYDGRLLTVPEHRKLDAGGIRAQNLPGLGKPTAADVLLGRPLSFHFLAGGVYDKRRNRAEADCIAGLVCDLLKHGQGLSIGVIAFSEAQQDEINVALNRLAAENEEFRRLLDEELQREVDGQFVGLLVKNLENIQGDERDVIILSVCYGRGPNGKMLMNFGPINKSGGEKRLNVAFSRAKQFMAVVSSIKHLEITNEYNAGANCLKSYLRYVEAMSGGDVPAAQRVLSGISRWKELPAATGGDNADAVIEQLSAQLQMRGYSVDLGVGQSHFRVDLAVGRPEDHGYRLGILVDTHEQYEQAEPLERDIMRPRLLRAFGWSVESVLAKDWYESREQVLDRLIEILKGGGTSTLDDDDDQSDDEEGGEAEMQPSDDSATAVPVDELGLDVDPVEVETEIPAGVPGKDAEQDSTPKPPTTKRRFEFQEGNSSKFWEIAVEGSKHTVRFGRIGSNGQGQAKQFATDAAAQNDAARLIAEKQRKGYREISPDS